MSSSSASTISYNHSLPSIRKYEEVNHRLEEINTKLAEVRKRRLQFAKEKGGSPHRQKVQHPKRTSKMHHPHLDFVLAEVAFSPYLTKPDEPYSRLVINIPDKLRALKHKNIKLDELPKDEKLLDMKKVKDIFINEDSVSSRSRKHSSATSICSSSLPSLQPRRAPSAQLLKKSWGDSPFERQEPGTDATENICSPVMANNGEGNVLPNFLTQQSEAASAEEDHYELLFDAAGIEESTKGAHAIADGLDNDKHQNVSEVLTEGKESSETDDGSKGENVSPNSFEQPSKAALAEEDHYDIIFDAVETNQTEANTKGAHAIADGLDNDKHQNVSEVLTEGKESSETDDGSKGENVSPNSFEQPSKAALAEEDHYDIIFDAVETNQTEASTEGAHAIADGLDNDRDQNSACITYCDNIEAGLTSDEIYSLFHSYSRLMFLSSAPS
eukprot:scaffold1641_cov146-Ochromonas_danica.AAC.1